MKFLIDENLSSPRLASRLGAQGHDPVLAQDVGLLSVTDARVLIDDVRSTGQLPAAKRHTSLAALVRIAGEDYLERKVGG